MLRSLIPWTNDVPTLANWDREFPGLLERMFKPTEFGRFENGFVPSVNVAETPEALEVTVDLPGMKPEDFHVDLHHGELWITGEKKEEKEEKGKTWHRMERRYGEFRRVIPVPENVNREKIMAEYKEGVLKVAIPKKEAMKPHKIEVKTGK